MPVIKAAERPMAFGLRHKDSARPVYLQERVMSYQKIQQPQLPPERPPKKPHLLQRENTPSPSSSSSSRVTTPTGSSGGGNHSRSSSLRLSKPKFPSPPGSPSYPRRSSGESPGSKRPRTPRSPTPPPPPPPSSLSPKMKELPLPPPPPLMQEEEKREEETTLRICDRENAFGAPASPNGCEGKYRRTSSPTVCLSPNVKPSANLQHPAGKSPAKTPKRESPATIAAKGAPGWEKFLGGKTSTVQFTSEELSKLKQQQRSRNVAVPPKPPPKPTKHSLDEFNANIGLAPIHNSKSSPSLNHLSPVTSNQGHKRRTWKNSLESLPPPPQQQQQQQVLSPVRGTAATSSDQLWGSNGQQQQQQQSSNGHHSHSNSDSGLSSLSGRTSTMSPISTMSTVSSSSSGSSSSRASLRSASIVSSCTIPLDEEEEEEDRPLGNHSKQLSSDSGTGGGGGGGSLKRVKLRVEIDCEELSREIVTELKRPGEDERNKKLTTLFGLPSNAKSSADFIGGLFDFEQEEQQQQKHRSNRQQHNIVSPGLDFRLTKARFMHEASSGFDDGTEQQFCDAIILRQKKEALLDRITKKLEVLRSEQVSLREETKCNEELGRLVGVQVMQLAQPNECEKYKLHVEETDKITSLLFGLSGRLARAENAILCLSTTLDDLDEKELLVSKRDKLSEQLGEAKKLKDNIDKRSQIVAQILRKYLNEDAFSDYQHFIKSKAKLIMDTRELQDKVTLGEEQLLALKETL